MELEYLPQLSSARAHTVHLHLPLHLLRTCCRINISWLTFCTSSILPWFLTKRVDRARVIGGVALVIELYGNLQSPYRSKKEDSWWLGAWLALPPRPLCPQMHLEFSPIDRFTSLSNGEIGDSGRGRSEWELEEMSWSVVTFLFIYFFNFIIIVVEFY